jgi:DNA-binding MarR family transcriptional regulator
MKKYDFSDRFGFLVNEVGRLYGRLFDQLSRERLGISRAQIRMIGVVATAEDDRPWTQSELAQRLDLTPMGVATLCDRMEAGGWLRRSPAPNDRRANAIELEPKALDVLDDALELSDDVQSAALTGLSAAERRQLVTLLQRVRINLADPAAAVARTRS